MSFLPDGYFPDDAPSASFGSSGDQDGVLPRMWPTGFYPLGFYGAGPGGVDRYEPPSTRRIVVR